MSQRTSLFEAEELKLVLSDYFMETIHPVVCYAMRIVEETTGKVFVFTGDSGYLESFADFAKDADLFLADTYLLKEMNIIMPISLQRSWRTCEIS